MTEPLFKVGDLVRFWAGARTDAAEPFLEVSESTPPSGVFEVIACLPGEEGQRQYRIRGGEPPHERVVREGQLTRAGKPQPQR